MSIDYKVGGFITQGLERGYWKDDSIYFIRSQTPIHGESTCNG